MFACAAAQAANPILPLWECIPDDGKASICDIEDLKFAKF